MKRKPIDRPIKYLDVFETALNGDLSSASNQYEILLPVKEKPSILNDEIIERIIRLHEEKNEFIDNYGRQFKLWRKEKLTFAQSATLENLERKLPQLKEVNDKVLEMAYQIRPYTIEKIMAMNPEELALFHLSGKFKSSNEQKSK